MAMTQDNVGRSAKSEALAPEEAAHRAMGAFAPALIAGAITTLITVFACPVLITYTPVIVSAAIFGAYIAMRITARSRR